MFHFAGVKELQHRKPQQYYLAMLGREPPPVARTELIDDNAMLDAIEDRPTKKRRSIRTTINQPGFLDAPTLAIEDAKGDSEGEPEELGDIATKTAEVMRAVVDKNQNHNWGPFKFTAVHRCVPSGHKKGDGIFQWQVNCPFHADASDAPGTYCTRTLGTRTKMTASRF